MLLYLLFQFRRPGPQFTPFQSVKKTYQKSDASLLDRHGEVLHELRVNSKGRKLDWVLLKDISPALKQTVLQSEDKNFYKHHGVDWKAFGAVLIKNAFTKNARGASTITMQLALLVEKQPGSKRASKTAVQKWSQIKAARELEKVWSKDEILEAYLNLLTFRGELQGLRAASRGLFDKEPNGLTMHESLILAALIRSPNAPSEKVSWRACALSGTLGLRIECDQLQALAQKVLSRPYFVKPRMSLAPHVAQTLLKSGKMAETTTLDKELQRLSADVLKHQLMAVRSQNVHDGAVLVVQNDTGEVLAYVGSAGEVSSARFVDGVQAKRQAGSSLKPFLYTLAFDEQLLTPASILDDSPIDVPTERGLYRPENYEKDYKGLVTARAALASSLNIPAVRTLSLTGVEPFISKLEQVGFSKLDTDDFYGLSLALGSADISLWQLVNAYRTLANRGLWQPIMLTFESREKTQRRVFSEGAAFLTSSILSDRVARSATFGLENPLATRFWTAVKTGTSKDMRDNWCVGFSSKYTVGVWVGNFSGASMWNVSGIVGAAPIWLEIMNHLHGSDTSVSHPPPREVIAKKVTFDNNIAPDRTEWFITGTEPESVRYAAAQPAPRILYPAQGTLIALDPDIPAGRQRMFFESAVKSNALKWVLNNKILGPTSDATSWQPEPGAYKISLMDAEKNILDSVDFKVRGNYRVR
ncbi:MAG: penicillin-binding protein 1C [Acidobacteria bacterium]|nr:penicillin-binding protein 1C [Acidobacteriota bacterium]MBI3654958.1 penicillin-binding protein 1C [Acidobacteriota bacterium]